MERSRNAVQQLETHVSVNGYKHTHVSVIHTPVYKLYTHVLHTMVGFYVYAHEHTVKFRRGV